MRTTKRNAPELSVIVPVYKVEAYLQECIDSILAQTFTDFELILVDDGSPDNCPAICDEAARKDPRIRVIHQKNGGVSAARNTGLNAARGEWIGFVDPDDFVAPAFYETLMTSAEQADADCAMCEVQNVTSRGTPTDQLRLSMPETVLTGRQVLTGLDKKEVMLYLVLWNKVYRKACWAGIRFPEGHVNEDAYVFAELFAPMQKVVCVKEPLYCYRTRDESIMTSRKTHGSLDEAWAFRHCLDYFHDHGMPEYYAMTEKRLFAKLVGVYYELSPEERRSPEAKAARKMQWDTVKFLRKNHCLSGRTLFRTVLFQAVPGLYGMRRTAYQKNHNIV